MGMIKLTSKSQARVFGFLQSSEMAKPANGIKQTRLGDKGSPNHRAALTLEKNYPDIFEVETRLEPWLTEPKRTRINYYLIQKKEVEAKGPKGYKPVGRPLQGTEVKKVVSIRLESEHEELLKKEFGSVQSFIDYMVRQGAINKILEDRK